MPIKLENYTKAELQLKAKSRGKICFSSLNKKQLIRFLRSGKKSPSKKPRSRSPTRKKSDYKNGYSPEKAVDIEKIIKNNDLVVVGKSNCPYCIKTKVKLDENNNKYKYIEYNKNFKDKLLEMNDNNTSVPMIFSKGVYKGGYSDYFD
jgi:glutaredoxin